MAKLRSRYLFPSESENCKDINEENFKEEVENVDRFENKQILYFEPTSFAESREIAVAIVCRSKDVVVDLSRALSLPDGTHISERIIDFLYGVSFALKIPVEREKESKFIFHIN